MTGDPRLAAIPDIHGHAKGEHKPFAEERPIPYTARMLFLWFFHACRRGSPRFMMVADHINYLTFEDPAAVNLVRRAFRLAKAGDLYGAAETAGVDREHARVVSEGLRRGMRFSIGAEVDNDPRSRPDAANIVDAMRPDGTIRSIHFLTITHPQHGEGWAWPFDNPEFAELYDVVGTERVWELYMKELLEAVATLPGTIVGHFYVPAKFGHWPADDVLETYEDQIVAAAGERGMALEINARYFYKYFAEDDAGRERFRTATLRLLRKAKAANVSIAVGSDAHSPKDQSNGFADVLALLDEAEINEIAFPLDGRLAHVALRATEEMRKNAAARPFGGRQPDHVDEPDEDDAATEAAAAPAEPEPAKSAKSAKTAASGEAAKRVRPARPSRSKAALAAVAAAKAAAGEATEPAGPVEPAAVALASGADAAAPAGALLEPAPATEPPAASSSPEPPAAAEAAMDAPSEPIAAQAGPAAPAPADQHDPVASEAEPEGRATLAATRPSAKGKPAPAKPPAGSAATRGADAAAATAKPRAKAPAAKPATPKRAAAAAKPAAKSAPKAGASKAQGPAKPAARPAKASAAAKAGAAKPQAAAPKGNAATKSQPKPAARPAAKAAAKPAAKAPASKAAAKPAGSKAAAKSGAPKPAPAKAGAAKPGAKKPPAKKASGAKQR